MRRSTTPQLWMAIAVLASLPAAAPAFASDDSPFVSVDTTVGQQQQQGGQQQGGSYSPNGGGGPGMDRRGLQDAISGLNALRGRLDPSDRAFRGRVDDTLGSLRTLNADPRLLDSAISQDAVTQLERLEVELGRRLGEQGAGGARSGAPEASPEKYRDAVAEYFKKLSQQR